MAKALINHVTNGLHYVLNSKGANWDLGFRPAMKGPKTLSNPFAVGKRRAQKPPMVATFVIGLSAGRGKPKKFRSPAVEKVLVAKFPSGGTIVAQQGWYMGTREKSLRVTIENTGRRTDQQFKKKIINTAGHLLDKFRQSEIWVDLYQGTEKVDQLTVYWKPNRR